MNEISNSLDAVIMANINLVIAVFGVIILPVLIFSIVKIANSGYREFIEFKNSQPEVVQGFLDQAVKIAYRFVEQKTKELDLDNPDKLELAIIKANEWLKAFNYDLPKDVIITALESFIHTIHTDGVMKLEIVKDMQENVEEQEDEEVIEVEA